jgi:GTPase SAR1 family protein
MNRHLTGEFEENYLATIGAQARDIQFSTNIRTITFNCCDVAGHKTSGGFRDKYYVMMLTQQLSCLM